MNRLRGSLGGVLVHLCLLAMASCTQPVAVHIVQEEGRVAFLRDGKTFRARGAGGQGSIEQLASAGANSTRTWKVTEATEGVLDEAHANGLVVAVGLKFPRVADGFDYTDPAQCQEHLVHIREVVRAYRDHPAVLLWGLGNEMEIGAEDPRPIWDHIERAAKLVRSLDPAHPTMTVIAEIGGSKIRDINRLCPSIDVIGINSYGGAASLPSRYARAGGLKPYLVTEFGTIAPYEAARTGWGVPIEPRSDVKAAQYRRAYTALTSDPRCLGGLAFVWGHKRQGTLTWHGMMLEDGSKLQSVDAMTRLWGGRLDNRCPVINEFSATRDTLVRRGETFTASISAEDPDGDELDYQYVLVDELASVLGGRIRTDSLKQYPEVVMAADQDGVTLRIPETSNNLRLYAMIRDGKGGAATASIPLHIE